jgi:tetratricopeptide (TPR) repeat protein
VRGLSWAGVAWAFSSVHASYWLPVTWLSHMVDCSLFGLSPGPPHLENVVWHGATVLLLYALLRRLTGRAGQSAFVAAVFAVHPLHVESVAWVTERKDVLSAFWGLAALAAYVRFLDRRTPGRYLAMLAAYAVGLMAKPMLVTWPGVMLLVDWWPLGRLTDAPAVGPRASRWQLLAEKIPLVAMAAASSVVTVLTQQRSGAVIGTGLLPIPLRLENAALTYVRYIGKFFWPVGLSPFYPWEAAPRPGVVLAAVAVLGAITIAAIGQARRRPYLVVGWLWYLGMLAPVIGLVQAGAQSMADRFMYLPSIGLLLIVAWGVPDVWSALRLGFGRPAAAIAAGASVAVLAVAARHQVPVWANSITVWQRAVAVSPSSYRLHFYLASALDESGAFEPAIAQYATAARLGPQFVDGQDNLSPTRPDPARAGVLDAVRQSPDSPAAHLDYGQALAAQGRDAEAMGQYAEALQLEPGSAEAHADEAAVRLARGDVEWAARLYGAAVQVEPNHADWQFALATALVDLRQPAAAIPHLEVAVRLKPQFSAAQHLLRELRAADMVGG